MPTKQTQKFKEFDLPLGYENVTEGFRRAFSHARGCGNGELASLLYAETWQDEEIPNGQIGRLRADRVHEDGS